MRAVPGQPPSGIATLAFWRDYLTTCRPYLCFVSGASGLVGLALAPDPSPWTVTCAMVAFFCAYGFGQALTDVFQTDTDSLSAPYRPLVQGRIKGGQVLVVSLLGLAGCALLLLRCNPWTLPLSGLGVLGLATYTPWKRHWWSGPAWNSWIVACLPVIGALCGVSGFLAVLRVPGLWWAAGSVFFSYATFVLLGYFKDVSADRATGYDTLPVHFGWRVTLMVSALSALLAVTASVGFVLARHNPGRGIKAVDGLALAVWAAGISLLVFSHVAMWSRHSESDAYGPIEHCLRGYLLLHIGEACVVHPSFSFFALVFYAGFEVALALRPERRQV